MKNVTLGSTGITVPQNGFGALPIQRVSDEAAVALLRRAYEGGMRFFDTARAYSDSEHKIGLAFGDWGKNGLPKRDQIYIASKTMATTPEKFWSDLETSLSELRTDYIDVYQLHNIAQAYAPGDGTGLYECMLEAKKQGKIRHISCTAHKIGIAEEAVASGLYETMQYPINYLSSQRELDLIDKCIDANMGFIGMKGMSGGLISNSRAMMAFISPFDNFVPIWGVQRESELDEWLSYFEDTPEMTPELEEFIEGERKELQGEFCRSCGYCMPCPQGIIINQCARMSLMLRRAPSESWLSEEWQKEMAKIETCLDCRKCAEACPYDLDTPALLRENYEDYKRVLAGEVSID